MKRLILLIFLLLAPTALAQLASGAVPEQVADEAVQAWLDKEPLNLFSLSNLPPEELCQELPTLLQSPAPPAGTRINIADRVELASDDDSLRRYSYPAALPGEQLEVVEVSLRQEGDGWVVERVGFRLDDIAPSIPGVLQQPVAAWGFIVLNLYLLYLLIRPSFFRRWLASGWQEIRNHRGTVIGTIIALYALFGLGVLSGASLPESCASAVSSYLDTALSELGATEAYGSGNIARAAVVTTYQNFVMGAVFTSFGPAVILGVPAYLFNGLRFYAVGIPFGFLQGVGPASLLFILILIIVELLAYILVTAGGGMLLVTIVKEGLQAYRKGLRKLIYMLPIAFLLLVIGAWYEAVVIILPSLFAGG